MPKIGVNLDLSFFVVNHDGYMYLHTFSNREALDAYCGRYIEGGTKGKHPYDIGLLLEYAMRREVSYCEYLSSPYEVLSRASCHPIYLDGYFYAEPIT